MSAIAGIVPRVRGCRRETLTRVVTAMRDAMARRAPLEGGIAVAYDASIALAHRGGGGPGGDCVLQPLRNESGSLLVGADGGPNKPAELRPQAPRGRPPLASRARPQGHPPLLEAHRGA